MKLRLTELNGELNDTRDQMAALDVEVSKLNNKCQVRPISGAVICNYKKVIIVLVEIHIYFFFFGDFRYTV